MARGSIAKASEKKPEGISSGEYMLAVAEGAGFFKEYGGATGARGRPRRSAEGVLNTVFVRFKHKPFFDVLGCPRGVGAQLEQAAALKATTRPRRRRTADAATVRSG
jgi:hypothetical protein